MIELIRGIFFGLLEALPLLLIFSLFGAFLLRVGVAMHNKLNRWLDFSQDIEEPSYYKAYGVALVVLMVNAVSAAILAKYLGGNAIWISALGRLILIALPLSYFLPARFFSAIVVEMCWTFAGAIILTMIALALVLTGVLGLKDLPIMF